MALCRLLVPRNHSVHGGRHYYFTSESEAQRQEPNDIAKASELAK